MGNGATHTPATTYTTDLHVNSLFSEMLWMLSGVPIGFMLQAVIELGVVEELADGPLSVEELGKRTESNPDALYRVLRGLATKGVFAEVSHRTFALTQLAQVLRSGPSNSLRDAFLMHAQKCMRDAFADVKYSLRTGQPAFEHVNGAPLFEYFSKTPEVKDLFERFAGTADLRIMHAALEECDLAGVRKLVDIGEMHGRLLASILTRYPEMNGVYFDLPFVVQGAEHVLRGAGIIGRAELVGGNYMESAPQEADVYLLPHVLRRLGDDQAVALLKNIRRVMSPTSRVLTIDPVLPEGDFPSLATVLDSIQLLLGPIRDRTEAEFAELFGKAGLRLTSVSGRALPSCAIVAVPDTDTGR
jgi:O-methyltransferase domain